MLTSKKCPDCSRTKKISSFYINRDYKEESYHDLTCTACSKAKAKDLNGLKEYCKTNRRQFSEALWNSAYEAMVEKYKYNPDYNSLDGDSRESFLITKAINRYFSRQSNPQYYVFLDKQEDVPEIAEDVLENVDVIDPVDEKLEKSTEQKSKEKKIFSREWNGSYTQAQLDYLDSYYADCDKDFNLTTRNYKDYAKKIAKASLVMDEDFNRMMNGVPGADKKYKESKAIFDTLSQSAKFSEKTRSVNDVAGLGSLSEIVLKLEQTGFLQKKITFPEDDIDKINKDFRWSITSVGGEI